MQIIWICVNGSCTKLEFDEIIGTNLILWQVQAWFLRPENLFWGHNVISMNEGVTKITYIYGDWLKKTEMIGTTLIFIRLYNLPWDLFISSTWDLICVYLYDFTISLASFYYKTSQSKWPFNKKTRKTIAAIYFIITIWGQNQYGFACHQKNFTVPGNSYSLSCQQGKSCPCGSLALPFPPP